MKKLTRCSANIASTFLLFACNGDSNNTLESLNANRAKWESANIDSYQFDFIKSCNCLDNLTRLRLVVVNANEVTAQTFKANNEALPLDTVNSETISDLFALIALEETRAESLSVEYHPELGYPMRIKVDRYDHIADDEYTIYVSNVQAADNVACTASVESGLIVNITDQSTDTFIACDAMVTATEGEYTETAFGKCNGSNAVAMLDERPGFYSIKVEKTGYQTFQVDDFGLGKDLCHVLPRELEVELIPQ